MEVRALPSLCCSQTRQQAESLKVGNEEFRFRRGLPLACGVMGIVFIEVIIVTIEYVYQKQKIISMIINQIHVYSLGQETYNYRTGNAFLGEEAIQEQGLGRALVPHANGCSLSHLND